MFATNLGAYLSLDETSLSHGELYAILINKAAKGGKGSVVAIGAGIKAETVIEVLIQFLQRQYNKLVEITLDQLAKWHGQVRQAVFKAFNTVARSIQNHYETRFSITSIIAIMLVCGDGLCPTLEMEVCWHFSKSVFGMIIWTVY